ncbi:MAG TPA: GNAT family N-acetyltransferase [Terriglobia bacterium]|nr:GNAT family N-acetyltransferase [Terriglobia bacterium]
MSQSHFEFRRATADDANDILSLWRAAEASPSVTDTIEDIRSIAGRDSAAVIVAVSQGQILGSIIAAFDGWRGGVYRLAVHPTVRRQGIARALVVEAEKMFRTWGVKRVSAIVLLDHPSAMGFWTAAGYAMQEDTVRFVRDF